MKSKKKTLIVPCGSMGFERSIIEGFKKRQVEHIFHSYINLDDVEGDDLYLGYPSLDYPGRVPLRIDLEDDFNYLKYVLQDSMPEDARSFYS